MEYRITSPCKGTNTYEIIPSKNVKLSRDDMISCLEKCGFEVSISSDMLAVGRNGPTELTIYTRGKLIIKHAKDKKSAESLAKEIISLL